MIPFNFLDTRGKIIFLLELSKVSCSHYHLHTLEGMSNPNRQVQIYFLHENQAVKANVTATRTRHGEIICLKMKRTQPQSFLSIWQNLSKDGIDQGKFVLITVALIFTSKLPASSVFSFRSFLRSLTRACARSLTHSLIRLVLRLFIHSFYTCHVEAIFISASSQSEINTLISHELKKENRNMI